MNEGNSIPNAAEAPSRGRRRKAHLIDGLILLGPLSAFGVAFVPQMLDAYGRRYITGEAAIVACVTIALALFVYAGVTLGELRTRASLGEQAVGIEAMPLAGVRTSVWRWWLIRRLPVLLLFVHLVLHTTIFIVAYSKSGGGYESEYASAYRWDRYPEIARGRSTAFWLGVAMLVAQIGIAGADSLLRRGGRGLAERVSGLKPVAFERARVETDEVMSRGAGFAARVGATSIDFLIVVVSVYVLVTCIERWSASWMDYRTRDRLMISVLLLALACTGVEAITGHTPGKWLLGLRIAGGDARLADRRRLLVRWFARRPVEIIYTGLLLVLTSDYARGLVFGLGVWVSTFLTIGMFVTWAYEIASGLAVIFGKRKRALHDMACGTNVFRVEQLRVLDGQGRFEPLMIPQAVLDDSPPAPVAVLEQDRNI